MFSYLFKPTRNSIYFHQVIDRDEIVGERLRQLDRYKDAVKRAEALRDAGKLPRNFDWSKLDDVGDDDLEELVSQLFPVRYCKGE